MDLPVDVAMPPCRGGDAGTPQIYASSKGGKDVLARPARLGIKVVQRPNGPSIPAASTSLGNRGKLDSECGVLDHIDGHTHSGALKHTGNPQ